MTNRLDKGVAAAIVSEQRRLNRTTRHKAALFAAHRARLTQHVLDATTATRGRRVLVLGAGNCNDLDLPALTEAAEEIHLVDVDGEALAHAYDGVPSHRRDRITLHEGLDVTGAMGLLCQRASGRLTLDDLEALADACLEETRARLPDAVDVALSPCLLSQLMDGARLALGVAHPDLPGAARALLVGHLRLLLRCLRPEGVALLASDVVDSQTVPLDALALRLAPREMLKRVVQSGQAFTGTDPTVAGTILQNDEVAAPLVDTLHMEEPWRWRLSDTRDYLVYALRFTRRAQ